MERILGSPQNLWEGQRDRLRAWMRTQDAGQLSESPALASERWEACDTTRAEAWMMTMPLMIRWNLDMVTAAAATRGGKESLRHSLCGLWFRVQGSAPDWLRPGHMPKLCRWKSLESKCLAFSASVVRGEQWALASAETQDGVFHTSGGGVDSAAE